VQQTAITASRRIRTQLKLKFQLRGGAPPRIGWVAPHFAQKIWSLSIDAPHVRQNIGFVAPKRRNPAIIGLGLFAETSWGVRAVAVVIAMNGQAPAAPYAAPPSESVRRSQRVAALMGRSAILSPALRHIVESRVGSAASRHDLSGYTKS
jgi:hypothetical protein